MAKEGAGPRQCHAPFESIKAGPRHGDIGAPHLICGDWRAVDETPASNSIQQGVRRIRKESKGVKRSRKESEGVRKRPKRRLERRLKRRERRRGDGRRRMGSTVSSIVIHCGLEGGRTVSFASKREKERKREKKREKERMDRGCCRLMAVSVEPFRIEDGRDSSRRKERCFHCLLPGFYPSVLLLLSIRRFLSFNSNDLLGSFPAMEIREQFNNSFEDPLRGFSKRILFSLGDS